MEKLWFDEHHLLTISFEDNLYSKEYDLSFSWYSILSKDKWILVYNKRQWRLLHFKEVSAWMQVCYLQENPVNNLKFNVTMLENVLALFQWFNEETWETYHYLPFYSKNIDSLEKDLYSSFWLKVKITKESQWNFVRWIWLNYQFPEELSDILGFVFSLIVIYWRFDEKNWEVQSFRVYIPLVWWTLIDEELNWAFKYLTEKYWIFIASQRVQNWNKIIYQFASNDKELLALCVGWMNQYSGKNDLKLDNYLKKQDEIKEHLVQYIENEELLDIEWRDKVLSLLKQYDVKFIKCL